MNILTEPAVTVLSRQVFLGHPDIDWESDSMVGGEALAEFAGRLCYLSFGEDAGVSGGHKSIPGRTTNAQYMSNILKVKHGSVLEHATWSLLLEGISRSLTHELVRHRAGFAYSQLSQRYVDESEVGFVLPPEIQEGTDAYDVWLGSCERVLDEYQTLLGFIEAQVAHIESRTLRRKRARETARSVLPNCAETKIVVTGNARAWRHLMELRGSPSADQEIRRLAFAIHGKLAEGAPAIFGDLQIATTEDGTDYLTTENPKV
jgi:thymidylate synthase (FAD)